MTTPSAPRISEDELARLEEAAERIRSHHDRTLGHSPTNRIGYCAEPDGISATYCETGILIAAARSAPAAGLDVERLRRIEAAARASSKAWDGMRAEATRLKVWDKPDEVIYQSPVQAALRAALAAEEVR